jgi:hypothetical protein
MSINAPAEPSCWEEALLRFRSECPKLYKHLEEIRATQPQSSPDSLAEDLLTVIDAKRKTLENHELHLPFNVRNSDVKARIQRALDIIWKAVQVFKTVGDLATNIDPLHAGVAWSGMNIILQVSTQAIYFRKTQGANKLLPDGSKWSRAEYCCPRRVSSDFSAGGSICED